MVASAFPAVAGAFLGAGTSILESQEQRDLAARRAELAATQSRFSPFTRGLDLAQAPQVAPGPASFFSDLIRDSAAGAQAGQNFGSQFAQQPQAQPQGQALTQGGPAASPLSSGSLFA